MKRRAFAGVAGAVFALLAAAAAFPATDGPTFRRIGLYIGSNNGGRDRVTLSYATSDAATMADVMNELGAVAQGSAQRFRGRRRGHDQR